MALRLEIKRKHIKEGKCGDPRACAIALAAREHFPNAHHISVCESLEIHESDPNGRTYIAREFALSKKAAKFMERFDGDFYAADPKSVKNVKPTTLVLKEISLW